MGKRKQGFNWEARSNKKVLIDNSDAAQIKVDKAVFGVNEDEFGDSNELVLPAKKRKTTVVREPGPKKRSLSKKQRRQLESVIERKKKKDKEKDVVSMLPIDIPCSFQFKKLIIRAELLEALSKVQVPDSELKLMSSTQDMHHSKTKKRSNTRKAKMACDEPTARPVNMIKGANKKPKNHQEVVSDSESSDCDITSSEDEGEEEEEEPQSLSIDPTVNEQLPADGSHPTSPVTTTHSKELMPPVMENKPLYPSLLSQLKGGLTVERDEDIQVSRMKLPILGDEQQIIETISESMVTIICGETGSGKTTQVPQFLYEAGYTSDGYLIGITEPRRVAAISMSKRVAKELGLTEEEVSFQIRYEGNTTPNTCIKFMTDGVLLKEIQKSFLLNKYRAIIIDEAHERSVYTDVLIGLLSRIVSLRHKKGNPLKLIIMSATLRVEDFRDNKMLFPEPPPVLQIDSRQFPVTIHFNKRTPDDYLTETFKKVCKIHRQLPAGGILVFVTGKQEVHTLCKKLQRTFPSSKPQPDESVAKKGEEDQETSNDQSASSKVAASEPSTLDEKLPNIELNSYSALPMDEQAELEAEHSDLDLNADSDESEADDAEMVRSDKVFDYEQRRADRQLPLHVLPLYSLLNTKRQAQVFEPAPEGCRLCVISTNVAETSLTIPNIKYVVDCGKTKNKFYDKVTGVSTFRVTFTSQASANQRAGRSGRTAPGHCYRIYSSSVFNDEFEKFSPPEIVSRPVDDLILQMKSMGIEKIINFPFPTPPSEESLLAAQDLLIKLGALQITKGRLKHIRTGQVSTAVTDLGKTMALFPVAPRYARMLALAHQKDLLEYIIAIVSACSVQELFMEGSLNSALEGEELTKMASRIARQKIQWSGKGQSLLAGDAMVNLKAVGAAEFAGCTPAFCELNGLRYKAISEVRKLRVQLTNIVNSVIPSAQVCVDPKMPPPTEIQAKLIRQIMLVGLGDRVARLNVVPNDAEPDVKKKMRNSYQTTLVNDYCYLHPTSVLCKKNPEYVIYQDIIEANDKVYLRGVTAIEPEWIPIYAAARCTFSNPLESPEPRFDSLLGTVMCHMSSTFGPHLWQMPTVEVEYPNKVEKYRYFAKALLEGEVKKKMQKYIPKYLASPSIMIKSWARLQPRTESLLKALYSSKICTRELLKDKWAEDSSYLLSEFLEWLPESEHDAVRLKWPPMKTSGIETDT